jgi:hypothetical protein
MAPAKHEIHRKPTMTRRIYPFVEKFNYIRNASQRLPVIRRTGWVKGSLYEAKTMVLLRFYKGVGPIGS